ncbi:hypothetical protein [Methylobacterium trifolii]|uniref:Uncharacterized protein n=1 Tax=Methylobacterium trifolii TaxID=1003092 RepID=A0ABQ4UA80_9HYPH|nr:hypothetical protein [Methylobacterium trifolii]GJE62660.1 hypothetical protein MPOCJGCO_4794 [Methylobacterium trifolii]
MLNADPLHARPILVNAGPLARVLDGFRSRAGSATEMWQLLTDNYVVDLDAVAALLPAEEPEPVWLAARG